MCLNLWDTFPLKIVGKRLWHASLLLLNGTGFKVTLLSWWGWDALRLAHNASFLGGPDPCMSQRPHHTCTGLHLSGLAICEPSSKCCMLGVCLFAGVSSELGGSMICHGYSSWADYSRGPSPGHDQSVSVAPLLWMLCSCRTGIEDTCVSVCFSHACWLFARAFFRNLPPDAVPELHTWVPEPSFETAASPGLWGPLGVA